MLGNLYYFRNSLRAMRMCNSSAPRRPFSASNISPSSYAAVFHTRADGAFCEQIQATLPHGAQDQTHRSCQIHEIDSVAGIVKLSDRNDAVVVAFRRSCELRGCFLAFGWQKPAGATGVGQ